MLHGEVTHTCTQYSLFRLLNYTSDGDNNITVLWDILFICSVIKNYNICNSKGMRHADRKNVTCETVVITEIRDKMLVTGHSYHEKQNKKKKKL